MARQQTQPTTKPSLAYPHCNARSIVELMTENQSFEDLVDEAEEDLHDLRSLQKRKLLTSTISWLLTVGLYWLIWDVAWVRWTLILIVPLALYNLYMITFGLNKVRSRYERLLESIEHEEN